METFVIHVPDKKSTLVKQILKGLGVTVQTENKSPNKTYAHDFLGLLSKKDAKLMDDAIKGGCEKINPDDWN
jgi:hypothetical protein